MNQGGDRKKVGSDLLERSRKPREFFEKLNEYSACYFGMNVGRTVSLKRSPEG